MKFKDYSQLDDVSRSLVEVLCSGGDERMALDAQGMNKYHCAPWPRDVVHFGSCTASQMSERGWNAAAAAHAALQDRTAISGRAAALAEMGEAIQGDILQLLTLSDLPGVRIVLTPSGSDAESIVLGLVGLAEPGSIDNIVVGAREVGSGTEQAAGARYFSHSTAFGQPCQPGDPADAGLAARTTVHTVLLRQGRASEREPEDVDAEIDPLVRAGVEQGHRVLVHVVAHSKTGLHAPRLETINRYLREYGDRVVGVIDAAQGRMSRRGLRDYLERGYIVILTGSKFYGGPSFSGAVLVPAWLSAQVEQTLPDRPFLPGYMTPAQLPAAWPALRASLSPSAENPGLMLRWIAALAEMRTYYEAPRLARYRVLRVFEAEVPRRLGASPFLELITKVSPLFDDGAERLLQSKTTVFSFRLYGQGRRPHTQQELARWVGWLHSDVSGLLPYDATPAQRRAAATSFQIGQSVDVSGLDYACHDYVIRIALGGVVITDVSTDERLGATLDERLDWMLAKIDLLAEKIALLTAIEARQDAPLA